MKDTRDWLAWKALLHDVPLPAAVVSLDALRGNARLMLERLGPPPTTFRIATKSLRVVALIRAALAACGDRARGLMTYSAHETAWLAEVHGFDDFVLAYPPSRPDEAAALTRAARRATIRVVVDDRAHVELLTPHPNLRVCIDVDAAWRPFGTGRMHLGVRRSPIRTVEAALALAERARARGLVVDALMAYEAQVAGLPDDTRAGIDPIGPLRRLVRARSQPVVAARRRAIVSALTAAGHPITLVNGGGTGSVRATAHDGTVTEVTVGSGFLASHLFDGYRDLRLAPAAFFALPVARVPDPGWVTCFSGGYVASGPPAHDRAPVVHAPSGLSVTGSEGWGEVQTPLSVAANAPPLRIGDPIVCRHAKAGEVFERFEACYLVEDGRLGDRVPTYRGEGRSFG